jgi:hypothetical protein
MHSGNPAPPDSEPPVLDLGSSDAMLARLDSLDQQGGLNAVADWVQRNLQPGKQIAYKGGEAELAIIYDRSVWRIDQKGQPIGEAVVPPLTDEKFGSSKIFAVWSRPMAKDPFLVRLRIQSGSR